MPYSSFMHFSKLNIQQIELYKISIPLIAPFVTSLGIDEAAKNVLVKIRTKEGIDGFGECSPYLPINGESQDTCFVVGQYFAKVLIGKNPLDIAACIQLMDAVIYGNSSIKSAFDMALYDIASQNSGQPLYEFIGGNNSKTIATDYTVSVGDIDKMVVDALQIKAQGFPAIKVKLGKNGSTDVQRIAAIRLAIGNEMPLRIDANQGWTVDEAIETLNALAPFNIQHCEEPIARWNILQLPKVKAQSPIPIMADECCSDDHDAEKLIALQACDYFNIKLGKSGGIYKALKIVKLATEANIHLQVGAMIESRLAMTAFAHFALCSPLITHFDFDTALMLKKDIVSNGILYLANGIIKVPEMPGLGASVEDAVLAEFESKKIV